MNKHSIKIDKFYDDYKRFTSEGKSVVFCAVDTMLKGLLAVEYPLKPTIENTVKNSTNWD